MQRRDVLISGAALGALGLAGNAAGSNPAKNAIHQPADDSTLTAPSDRRIRVECLHTIVQLQRHAGPS